MRIDLTRILTIHLALLLAAAVVCVVTGWGAPASLVLGGAVMGLNVWLLKLVTNVLVAGADESGKSGNVGLAVGGFVLHFGLFIGMAAALFWRLPVDAMSFAGGVTMLLVACVIEAVQVGRVNSAASQLRQLRNGAV